MRVSDFNTLRRSKSFLLKNIMKFLFQKIDQIFHDHTRLESCLFSDQYIPLWQKKSNGCLTQIFCSIFDFRFSIFDFRFLLRNFQILVRNFRFSILDFRFSISFFRFSFSICQRGNSVYTKSEPICSQ